MSDIKPPIKGYAIWFDADVESQTKLQGLINTLAEWYEVESFLAHATLIGLLDKTKADLEAMQLACRELAGMFSEVLCEITGVGVRDAYFQSVFLTAVPSDKIVAINSQARILLGHEADVPYMPHWSAVYGDFSAEIKKGIVSDAWGTVELPMTVQLRNINLVDVSGHPKEWKIIESFPIGK